MDRNDLRLVGRVGDAFKRAKAQNGTEYIWFQLELEPKDNSTSVEKNQSQVINIMCFKKNVIKYVERVKMRAGNIVVIFGFVSCVKQIVKGSTYYSNAINANEIYVVKTKQDD